MIRIVFTTGSDPVRRRHRQLSRPFAAVTQMGYDRFKERDPLTRIEPALGLPNELKLGVRQRERSQDGGLGGGRLKRTVQPCAGAPQRPHFAPAIFSSFTYRCCASWNSAGLASQDGTGPGGSTHGHSHGLQPSSSCSREWAAHHWSQASHCRARIEAGRHVQLRSRCCIWRKMRTA